MRKAKYGTIIRRTFLTLILGVLGLLYGNSSVSATCSYPSQILNLTNWKETLPTGSGKPTEIKQTKLTTFLESPYFMPNSSCNGVIFRAPVKGATTSNSGYPRSELREMKNGGKDLASWSPSSGAHGMFIDQAITSVPKKKRHVVAGQIHDSDDDVIVVRLEYPKLFIDVNGKEGPTLDSNYKLGKRFTVEFLASDGKIMVYYNGSKKPAHTIKKSGSGHYFKAGAYTQSNCSKESDCGSGNYGEVVIYGLKVKHQSSSANVPILASAPAPKPEPEPKPETAPEPEPVPVPEPEQLAAVEATPAAPPLEPEPGPVSEPAAAAAPEPGLYSSLASTSAFLDSAFEYALWALTFLW